MSDKTEKKTKRVKRVKQEGEPSKPKSPYILFCIDERVNINSENAAKDEASRLKNKEIIAELGSRWKSLKESDPSRLEYYNKKADESRSSYTQEMEDWKKVSDEKQVELKEEVTKLSVDKKSGTTRKKREPKASSVVTTQEVVVDAPSSSSAEVEVVVEEEAPKKKEDDKKKSSGKKITNPYLNFLAQSREQYKKDHPDVPSKEVSSKLSEMWKAMSDEEKAKFKN
jgi:hypothetical protein